MGQSATFPFYIPMYPPRHHTLTNELSACVFLQPQYNQLYIHYSKYQAPLITELPRTQSPNGLQKVELA